MWPRRAIGVAGGVDQRPAERFRRNADVEGDHFRRDRAGRVPGDAAVERTVDGDDIGGKVVPGHGERAVGAHERHGADGSSRSAGVVGAVRDKARSMVRGVSDADAAGARSAERRVPGDVDMVAERARGALVHGDHRLVVEVVRAPLEGELREERPAVAAVARAGHRQLRAVDATEIGAEEDGDEAVESIALGVEGERRIGAEPRVVGTRQRWRQGHVDAAPAVSSVRRKVCPHREPEDLVGPGGELARAIGVQGDEGLALWAALVRHVDVAAEGRRRRRRVAAERPVGREILILVPPGWIIRIARRLGCGQRGCRRRRFRGLAAGDGDATHGDGQTESTDHWSPCMVHRSNVGFERARGKGRGAPSPKGGSTIPVRVARRLGAVAGWRRWLWWRAGAVGYDGWRAGAVDYGRTEVRTRPRGVLKDVATEY